MYKRLVIFAVSIVLLVCNPALSVPASAAEADNRIRVGYYVMGGFQEIDRDGSYNGYNYEYMQKIAGYTGWEYEYVQGTLEECIRMLREGKIDLLAPLQKTEERRQWFDFSESSIGMGIGCLLTLASDETYAYQDYASFNGMKVGMVKGSTRNVQFEDLEQKEGFTVRKSSYDSEEELLEALRNGEVEGAILSTMQKAEGVRIIAQFEPVPFYYATTKGNTELLDKLDKALDQIKSIDPFYDYKLYEKHYGNNMSKIPVFTVEERKFIADNPVITVVVPANREPIIYYDSEKQAYAGIEAELLELLADRLGVTFRYSALPKGMNAMEYLQSGSAMVAAGISETPLMKLASVIALSDSLLDTEVVFVVGRDKSFDLETRRVLAIAAPTASIKEYFASYNPSIEIKDYESLKQCFQAVERGEADCTVSNIFTAQWLIDKYGFTDKLSVLPAYAFEEQLKLGVLETGDARLMAVLNKAIASLSKDDVNRIVVKETSVSHEMNLGTYIQRNPLQALLIMTGAFTVVILLLAVMLYSVHKRNVILHVLNQKAQYDDLTGIFNKRAFYDRAQALLHRQPDIAFAMLYIDVEHFKIYNDIFGVKGGDELLCFIASELKSICGEEAAYGRIEADHFAVCCEVAKLRPEKLMEYLHLKVKEHSVDFEVTFCLGVYVIDDRESPMESMCDRAMLAAKAAKDSYLMHLSYYDDSMRRKLLKEQLIVSEMQNALDMKQFVVYLQPQVELATGKVVGAEALVRWNHPVRGIIMPAEFIPVFEKNGFIMKLDEFVWRQSCEIMCRWKKEGRDSIPISVNLSRVDVYNPNLCDMLGNMVSEYGLSCEELNLEVTETAYAEKPVQLIEVIERLRLKGFILQMDDFGSGYSSLNSLKNLPVDVLKLDLHFLAGGKETAQKGENIITAVILMAKWLKLKVLAEGVENKEQVDYLRSIGCEFGQGYHYAKPMPVAEFERFMENM